MSVNVNGSTTGESLNVQNAPSVIVSRPELTPIEEVNSKLNGRQPLFARLGYEDIQTLEGRLLTLVDASFSDMQQRKAFKDLVRQQIWWHWANNLDRDDSVPVGIPDRRS